jgi:hypothetical protein
MGQDSFASDRTVLQGIGEGRNGRIGREGLHEKGKGCRELGQIARERIDSQGQDRVARTEQEQDTREKIGLHGQNKKRIHRTR